MIPVNGEYGRASGWRPRLINWHAPVDWHGEPPDEGHNNQSYWWHLFEFVRYRGGSWWAPLDFLAKLLFATFFALYPWLLLTGIVVAISYGARWLWLLL